MQSLSSFVKADDPEYSFDPGQPPKEIRVADLVRKFWQDDQGQDVAEYAVMLAVILVIVIGTVRLIGSHADTIFSQVGSSIQ